MSPSDVVLVELATIAIVAAIFWNLWRIKGRRSIAIRERMAEGFQSPFLCRDTLNWVDDFEREMWRNRGRAACWVWLIVAPVALLCRYALP